jgi:hypothetical protein
MTILFSIFVLMTCQTVKASHFEKNLKKVQPQIVAAKNNFISDIQIKGDLRAASEMAERLDKKAKKLLNVMSLNAVNKWIAQIDEDRMRYEYAEDLMQHMHRMSAIFRLHRKVGTFARFKEFEFQNLLTKSDYLLSLVVTKRSVDSANSKKEFLPKFKAVLAEYNAERVGYDQKMIQFSFASN